jgi:hypothetical protein
MVDHGDNMLAAYAEKFAKFAWPAEQPSANVPIEEAVVAMRKVADSMPSGTMEKDKARAKAVGAEADKWRPKMAGDKRALTRIDSFLRSLI